MPVGHFHHVVLEVSDLDRSEQFYRDTLELAPAGRGLWPDPYPNAAFRTGRGQYVVLVQVPEPKPDGPGVHTNFLLAPERYHVIYDRLKEQERLVVDHRAEQRSVGEVSTYFNDPDGRRLQMTAFSPEAFTIPAAGRGKIVAGRLDDFPMGSVTYNADGQFYLVHLQDGILAISEVCTHRQCKVTYQSEHYRFYCPCHYRKYTRAGVQIAVKQDTPPLHTYPIAFVDGQIVVDTDTSVARTEDEADRLVPLPAGV